jgi:hypothetical protein
MAELIPLEYRVRMARRRHVRHWAGIVAAVAVLSGASLTYAYLWQRQHAQAFADASAQYRAKAALLEQAKDLRGRRQDLAAKMQKMQELREDAVVLSLLRNVSGAFTAADALESITIDARPGQGRTGAGGQKYTVQLTGITATDGTHADLLSRLTAIGAAADPPLAVTPESLRREPLFDGQVMRFVISGEKPAAAARQAASGG